ncbi:MAG TPA: threonine-phosphate decarboxylase CobD [Pyrinomonadaceae bacterium]|nr:threonine-phosphate decarboxylase CobD [Pyrinomonadaceae bacterium]
MNAVTTPDKILVAPPAHGGDVAAVAAEFGVAPEELLDFSANINPLGPPTGVLRRLTRDAANAELLMRYPEAELKTLRRALSVHAGVEENQIIIGGGAAALIETVTRAVCRKKDKPRCLLPVPAFSEYERALLAADFQIVPFALEKEENFSLAERKFVEIIADEKPDLCIVTNPHNPTGALIKRQVLKRIARAAEKTGTILLLDEAFIDYAPEESLTRDAERFKNLVVLRSLTKFYGIPALRVGYAVSSTGLIKIFANQLSSWSVTTLAANAAEEAVKDFRYAEETLEINRLERKFLSGSLKRIGFRVFPSAANFLFLELPAPTDAARLRANLIKQNRIIIRDCSTYAGLEAGKFVRVAVRSRQDNELLVKAIYEYFG